MARKEVQFEQPSELLLFFNRFWVIVTAILVGVLLLGGYYLFVQPKINSNDALRESALQTSIDQENSKKLLSNLDDLKKTYEKIMTERQADLDRLKEIIPNNPQIAELFVLSDRLSWKYGFQLLDVSIVDSAKEKKAAVVQVSNEDENGAPTVTTATTTLKNKNIIELKSLIIDFKITPVAIGNETTVGELAVERQTPYQMFKEFLDALERNMRLTDIQSINFASMEGSSNNPLQFEFSVQTYYR